MSIPKQIAEITEQDLGALVAASVREGKAIEYKVRIALDADDQKRRFVASVASFANASGGDLVFGISAEDGLPKEMVALKDFEPDRDIRTLRDLIRAHIDPPLFGVEFREVAVQGGFALTIRVPRAWDGAHMVTYNNDNRFYTRDANGRVLMNVPEIRSSFSAMESVTERIRRFRLERLAAIRSGELPFPVQDRSKVVIHLCPIRSFEPGSQCDLAAVLQSPKFRPLNVRTGHSIIHDVDAAYVSETADNRGSPDYGAVTRTGCVEIVHCFGRDRWIPNPDLESRLVQFLPDCMEWVKISKMDAPVVVMLSVLDVQDYCLYSGPSRPLYVRRIRQRDLIMHDVLVDNLSKPAAEVLRPFCDSLWRACGMARSLNFDKEGQWNPQTWN